MKQTFCADCHLNIAVYKCLSCNKLICAPCAKGEMLYHDCKNTGKQPRFV